MVVLAKERLTCLTSLGDLSREAGEMKSLARHLRAQNRP